MIDLKFLYTVQNYAVGCYYISFGTLMLCFDESSCVGMRVFWTFVRPLFSSLYFHLDHISLPVSHYGVMCFDNVHQFNNNGYGCAYLCSKTVTGMWFIEYNSIFYLLFWVVCSIASPGCYCALNFNLFNLCKGETKK